MNLVLHMENTFVPSNTSFVDNLNRTRFLLVYHRIPALLLIIRMLFRSRPIVQPALAPTELLNLAVLCKLNYYLIIKKISCISLSILAVVKQYERTKIIVFV